MKVLLIIGTVILGFFLIMLIADANGGPIGIPGTAVLFATIAAAKAIKDYSPEKEN